MTDKERSYGGLSNAAWGYFFLTFNLSLWTINVLPTFVGWFLFRSAIEKLEEERRELKLLRPLCMALALWCLAGWTATLFLGTGLSGRLPVVDLLAAVVALYFHFQFLTDLAALAQAWQPEGEGLDCRLRRRRTAYVLILTVGCVAEVLVPVLGEDAWAVMSFGLGLVGILEAIFIMRDLFSLRRYVEEGNWEQEEKNS